MVFRAKTILFANYMFILLTVCKLYGIYDLYKNWVDSSIVIIGNLAQFVYRVD